MLTNVELPIEELANLVANQLSINGDPNLVSKKELEAEVLLILQSKFDLIQKQINLLSKTKNVSEVNDLHLDNHELELVLSNGTTYSISMLELLNTINNYIQTTSNNVDLNALNNKYTESLSVGLEKLFSQQDGTVNINGVEIKSFSQAIKDAINITDITSGIDTSLIIDLEQNKLQSELNALQVRKNNEHISVLDFFTEDERVAYDANPTTFDAYRPLQAFFDYLSVNYVPIAYCNGDYRTSKGIIYGNGNALSKLIIGDFTLTALTAIDILFNINAGQDFCWLGRIKVTGTGTTANFSSRTCRIGVQISSQGLVSSRNKFTAISATHFYEYGIYVAGVGSLSSLGFLRATRCGSGLSTSGYSLTSSFTFVSKSGSASSTTQRSTINVTTMPPDNLVPNLPLLVIINNQPYYVYNRDYTNNTLSVFPFLDNGTTSGTLIYSYGGGVGIDGGDSSVLGIDTIDAMVCGRGYVTGALYPANVDRMVSQLTGAAVVLGQNPTSAMIGGNISEVYCENNDFDLVRVTRADINFNILNSVAFNFNKIVYACAAKNASDKLITYNNLKGIAIGTGGNLVTWQRQSSSESNNNLDVTSIVNGDFIVYNNTANIVIKNPDVNLAEHFGRYTRRVIVFGSSTQLKPTSVTFTLEDGNIYKINDAITTSVTFNNFDGVAVFDVVYKHDLSKFIVSQTSNKSLSLLSVTATYDPASLATATQQSTTITLTGAKLGDTVAVSFNKALNGTRLWAEVTATDTVTVYHRNDTGATVDLPSGTLTIKIV